MLPNANIRYWIPGTWIRFLNSKARVSSSEKQVPWVFMICEYEDDSWDWLILIKFGFHGDTMFLWSIPRSHHRPHLNTGDFGIDEADINKMSKPYYPFYNKSRLLVCGFLLTRIFLDQGGLNINMSSYQYRDPHVKDKTVSRPSYL